MTTETTDTTPEVTDDLASIERQFFNLPEKEDSEPEPVEQEQNLPEQEDSEEADEAQEVAEQDQEEEQEEENEEQKEQPRKKRTTAERIKRLDRDRRHWEREALAKEERLKELEAKLAAVEKGGLTPEQKDDNDYGVKDPDHTKYRYGELDPQYMADLADARAERKLQAYLAKQEQAQQAAAAEREIAQVRERAEATIEAGRSKFSDFYEVVVEGAQEGDYPLTEEMFSTIVETEVAPDILYYLAQNPDEAEKVASLSPKRLAMWAGRMEAEIKAVLNKPAPKKITQAPPPVATFPKGSGGKGGPRLDDPDDPRALFAIERELFGRK